jgi:hypothetical protein
VHLHRRARIKAMIASEHACMSVGDGQEVSQDREEGACNNRNARTDISVMMPE